MEFSPDKGAPVEPATVRARAKLEAEMKRESEAAGKAGPVADKVMRGYQRHAGERVDVKETGRAADSSAVLKLREELAAQGVDKAVSEQADKVFARYAAPAA